MRIEKEQTQVLVIDMQERLFPYISNKEELLKKVLTLVEGTKALGLPIVAARQYPKGLGDIVEELRPHLSQCHDKMTFSCCGSKTLLDELQAEAGRKNIIIVGIEAHVCVLQTVIDLKALGFTPIVVVDAVNSRHQRDYEIALKRMEYEGVVLTTVEAILFELCYQAGHEGFKIISRLVK